MQVRLNIQFNIDFLLPLTRLKARQRENSAVLDQQAKIHYEDVAERKKVQEMALEYQRRQEERQTRPS